MLEAGRAYDVVAETPMFQRGDQAPLMGSPTPEKNFGSPTPPSTAAGRSRGTLHPGQRCGWFIRSGENKSARHGCPFFPSHWLARLRSAQST